MKFYMIFLLLILFQFVSNILNAQTPRPLDFFPHHQGDIFEYHFYGSTSWFQNIITKDSLGNDGKYYLETTYFGKISVDTIDYELRNREWGGADYSTLLCKLNADSGDSWIIWRDSVRAIRAKVIFVLPASLLSEKIIIKRIDYVDSASGFYLQSYDFGSGFGILAEYEDLGIDYNLRGAKINGVTYGTVTNVNITELRVPNNLTLYHNYPNPFNTSTTIEYNLKSSGYVRLIVYNVLGQIVRILTDSYRQLGTHIVKFDASNLPTGIYFCRLIDNSQTKTIKMLYVR